MESMEDLRQHIRKRLTEIDDLKERKAAREILLEGLVPIFELTEKRYTDLENRIRREIEIPNEKYAVSMTVIKRKDYDPVNGTLYPVCPALLADDVRRQEKPPYLIYFAGNCFLRREFEREEEFQGSDSNGKMHTVKIRKAACYQKALADLYQVFIYNRTCWTTVNTGYMDRFYEVCVDEDIDAADLNIDFGRFAEEVKTDMLLLWNIEEFAIQCHKFMIPCIDGKYYEHELDLNHYDQDSGYMLGVNEDVLKVRHERDKIYMTSLKESFQEWKAYRFAGMIDTGSHGYTYELLSNIRKNSFFQNYMGSRNGVLSSRTELFWVVQSFENNRYVSLEECEVLESAPQVCLEGDMNPFLGNPVFPMETRKILALYFSRKSRDAGFGEDMVRFFVSQIQLLVCEYKCVGVLREGRPE